MDHFCDPGIDVYWNKAFAGNVLAWVQQVHKPVDFWSSPFIPADFEAFITIETHLFGDQELRSLL